MFKSDSSSDTPMTDLSFYSDLFDDEFDLNRFVNMDNLDADYGSATVFDDEPLVQVQDTAVFKDCGSSEETIVVSPGSDHLFEPNYQFNPNSSYSSIESFQIDNEVHSVPPEETILMEALTGFFNEPEESNYILQQVATEVSKDEIPRSYQEDEHDLLIESLDQVIFGYDDTPAVTKRSFTEEPHTEIGPLVKRLKIPHTPRVKETLLQNLPGLQSVRVANNYNEYTAFPDTDIYSYEPAKRARANGYEPTVIRRELHTTGAKNFGLCPYCPDLKFLSLNSSAYVHHLTICHGVFSDGSLVKEPTACVEEVLTNSGKKEQLEFFHCPYECELGKIRMIKFKESKVGGSRYKVYLRHVKDCHNCGKRDRQQKRLC